MKKIAFSLLFMFGFLATAFAQNEADACLGTWLTGSKKGHIQVYKLGDKYFGKIIWIKEPNDAATGKPKTDTKNPNDSKKSQPLLGLINLRDFKFSGENVWENGKVYDPENGKEYSCKMKLNNPNQLDVRGFVGISILGRTDSWTRVK